MDIMQRKIIIYFTLVITGLSSANLLLGQTSYFSIYADTIAENIPALKKRVEISVSDVSIQEFLRAVANASGMNMNVDPTIAGNVTNNFNDVLVKDMLLFLEKNYPVKVEIIGNIINVAKKEVTHVIETDFKGLKYDTINQLITLDYYYTKLNQVAREITMVTGNNIILAPSISELLVSGYVESMPLQGAIEQFAFSNDLIVKITEGGYFVLDQKPKETEVQQQLVNTRNNSTSQTKSTGQAKKGEYILEVRKHSGGKLTVYCSNAPILEVITKVSDESGINYFITTDLEGTISFKSEDISYESFLKQVLSGTDYIFTKNSSIYVIGANDNAALKHSVIFQFQNRTIDKLLDILPQDIVEGLIVKEFPDLNSLIISGDESRILNLTALLSNLDKTVPVILIEVIIVNVSRNFIITTGIDAGIGDAPLPTLGGVFPGIDIQLGSQEINKILNGPDGLGVLNLGNVIPNFYILLKAMEQQGILDITSTPKLSTLNGHEATLNIGNTEYYLEETSNYIGSQNPSLSTSKTYKSVKAELAVTIRPIVSGDDQITLDIMVEQSDFTDRISNEAPPGTVNRKFESMIRVKNQETIILGGLEEKRFQDSSSGTPLFSKIPILKWFFSSRNRQDQKSKLTIFIKPTIIG